MQRKTSKKPQENEKENICEHFIEMAKIIRQTSLSTGAAQEAIEIEQYLESRLAKHRRSTEHHHAIAA